MAYVGTLRVTVFLIFCDVFLTALRASWKFDDQNGDIGLFVLLSIHEVVVIALGVCIFAFFSYTVWFTAGLLGQLWFTIRPTFPVWVLRLFFVQMPVIYGKYISKKSRPWDDPVYGVLYCLDLISCLALNTTMFYSASCLSEKTMYSPYHRKPTNAIVQRNAVTTMGSGLQVARGGGQGPLDDGGAGVTVIVPPTPL